MNLKKLKYINIKILDQEFRFHPFYPTYIPNAAIKQYYGEKISLYFKFLGFYTDYLLVIAILGAVTFFLQEFYSNISYENRIASIAFSIVIQLWSTYMVEKWKQQQL